ncbi:MAG TPA: sigma-70 family RNA polymerase sigma factor [Jatrophihabitantaceae bacterium]|jgi:RNA polymerase sigma-70 factor (ECF subfamily)
MAGVDPESVVWIESLAAGAPGRDAALARLHALLLRAARAELSRRAARSRIAGAELDDLAHQVAADALMSITRRLTSFRGESRFTTWAYRFVILEVSSKLGRHFWSRGDVVLEPEQWDQVPARLGVTPEAAAEAGELFAAVRSIVETQLTSRQREIFVALLVQGIPADALAVKLQTNRNAIYKAMFDVRRKIRATLVTDGYLGDSTSIRS